MVKKTLQRLLLPIVALTLVVVSGGTAFAVSPHEVPNNPITCSLGGDNTVTCSGSIAGLGTGAVIVTVDVAFACSTRGNNSQPPGHLQGSSGPITPRAGRINFSVTTGPAQCPPGLNPSVGKSATITVSDLSGNVLFQETVRIQGA